MIAARAKQGTAAILAVALVQLSACGTVSSGETDRQWALFDSGAEGFLGQVEAFGIPIEMSYAPVPYYSGTIRITHTDLLARSKSTFSLFVRGLIRETGNYLLVEQSIFVNSVSRTVPLFVGRARMGRRGNVIDYEVDVSGAERLGIDEAAIDAFRSGLDDNLAQHFMFPTEPVVPGDNFNALQRSDFDLPGGFSLGRPAAPEVDLASWVVAGLTWSGERRSIVATISSSFRLEHALLDDGLNITFRGYALFDVATGIPLEGLVGVRVSGRSGGVRAWHQLVTSIDFRI